LLNVFIVAFITFFILWPFPWFHIKEVLDINYQLRIKDTGLSVPEVFFGKLVLVPKSYYLVYFFITTPIAILIFLGLGFKKIYDYRFTRRFNKKIMWFFVTLVVWFTFPFIQSLYNFRQHGVRYIIEFYAPLSLIAAIGFDYIVSYVAKKAFLKFILFLPVVMYLLAVLSNITPYYIDYFNSFVGGPKKVYEKQLFQMGWWGEGIKEATNYLDSHAGKGSTVGFAAEPAASIPPVKNLKIVPYKNDKVYNYLIVSFYHVVREGFDDSKLKKNYKPVYDVLADGAAIVTVYKHK
jgi:hypothetical protein